MILKSKENGGSVEKKTPGKGTFSTRQERRKEEGSFREERVTQKKTIMFDTDFTKRQKLCPSAT